MTNAVTIVPYADIERMAIAVAKSGLFGIRTKEQAEALMVIAQAEGRHPAIAARDSHHQRQTILEKRRAACKISTKRRTNRMGQV